MIIISFIFFRYIGFVFMPSKDSKTYVSQASKTCSGIKLSVFDRATSCYYKSEVDNCIPTINLSFDNGEASYIANTYYFVVQLYYSHEGTIVLKVTFDPILTCLPSQYNYFNQACYEKTTIGCHTICNGLCLTSGNPNIFAGSTQHCLSTKIPDSFIFYSVIPYDDEIDMYGTIYTTDMTILHVTGMNCHPNCGGVCTKPNDPMSCGLWCSADPLVDDTRRFFGYCPCKSSAKMSSNKMQCIAGVQCSSFCDNNECGEDPTDCVRCITNIPHFIGVPSGNFYYKCQCETDWTLVNNECICTACFEGCEPTKCTSPRDAQKCTKCKSGYRSINQKDGITVYCYKCADNEIDYGNGHCDPGYKTDCSPLCNGNCMRQRDKTACFACINRLNLESAISSPVTLKCTCKEGTAEFGSNSLCVYQTGCHTYCIEGCTIKNSLYHCASALPNGICTSNNDNLDYTCSGCNTNTSLTAYGCSKISYTNCHSSCTASGCTQANDPTACVECFQDRTLTTNGKMYCGPCQFNDVSLCMQFNGVCWKNYKHPLETANLSSFECASSLAKTCYPIWKQNGESDFQCRDYLKTFNITLLEAIPKALSASHVKANEGANVIIKFDIDVNFQNIQHCSIMLTPETISKLGNSYSCKWLSPKEYSIIYSPINGFLTNLTIRANTVYSSFAYALFAMESVTLLVENNGVITFEGILYAPSFVLPSLGLTMTMSVKPICGLNWSYAWHFSYLLGGPQSQIEKKFIADFFNSYGIKSSKTMMVAIPAEVLYKNSILRVAANAFSDLTKNPVVSEAIVIILNELTEQEIYFDLNSKSAITQILTSRKKNQIHIPLLWKNISSYSSENINSLYMTYGKAGNTSVRLEIKSGEKRNQIVTRGEHELILEKKLLQNFIRFRMLNFEVVQKSPNINLFKSYTYYNITMMAQYHLINGNFNNNTDSMIVFFTRQSPVCRITTEWFIINPYIDNDIYSTTSEIDYGYGDEISYLWSCESCQKLSSPFDNCSCDVFHSPGIRRKHITTIKAYALTDLCKYVFSLSITVSNKNFVRSCYTTKEIATINYMNTGLKALALPGFEGRSSSKSEIYISAEIINPDMLEGIKSFTWELLEVERKISAQNKFSKRSSFYTRAMKNNIYNNRWLLEINNNTDNSFIPAEYNPKVIDLPQVIPPLLGISKASLPPDTSFTYLLNITYNSSSRKPLYSEANFETSSDPSLRELIISPINGTEYSTKFIFTFVPIANIDPNEEAEFQLFRKDCPNSTNQSEDIYIPFTIRLRNIFSFSSILAGGKIECDYQVGIKLKIYNKERVIETSKTIRVIYLKEKDRKANINSLIEELKDFNYNYNSVAQIITQLYQISSNSPLLSLNELSRLLDILSRYDTEFIDSLSELFTEEEQTSFIELCLQMISNIANSGSKLITEPIFGSLIGKVKNYANMIRNLSSPGISLFPVVVYTLDALANNIKAQSYSKRYAEEIMPIIYLLIEAQIKEIIPNARAYQIFYPNINISIKSTSSSYASQVDLNHSLSVNQSVLFPSKLVTNFLSSIPKQTQALTTVLVSVSFNPYNEIKQNIIISNASLSNISLAQGKITPEILSAIYNDIRNNSDKYNSIISPTLIYSNILHASLYLTTYSKEEGQKIINITSPIEPLLTSQKVLASISLLSPSLLSADNTIILPLYYNNKKKFWTNNQCDIDSNLTLLNSTNSTVLPFNDKNNKNKRNTTYFSSDIRVRCSFINNDTDLEAGHATIILAVEEIPDIDKIERLWQNQGLSQVYNEQAVDVRITAIILGFFFVIMGFVGSGIIIRIEDKSSITVKCQALSARYNKYEASSSSPKKDSSPPIASPRAISPIIASQTSATFESCLKRLAKFSLDVREKGYANIEPAAQTTLETNPAQRKSSGFTEEASPTERKIVTFKDFPCLFERDISENEEKELMQIYGYLHPSKKQVKITREALIEEINKSIPLHYITTKFIEEKNDIFKGSISGLIIVRIMYFNCKAKEIILTFHK